MQKKKFIYLIVGRSGVGKDYLAKLLYYKGLNMVISYTTRPKRYDGENTHIFISSDEAAEITDKVARTEINGYEYFATRRQVEDSDLYIIDPNGIEELVQNMPDVEFGIIYVESEKKAAAKAAEERGMDRSKEREIFEKRRASEDTQFTRFEENWEDMGGILEYSNVVYYKAIYNDYKEETMSKYADELMRELARRSR